MAFSSTIKGETAGVGGSKKIFGTWDSAGVAAGTITWKGTTQVYNPIGAGVVSSTALTTVGLPQAKMTAGTLVLVTDSDSAGVWWVEVQ